MRYRVDLTAKANCDILSIYKYIVAEPHTGADRWIDQLDRALDSLEFHPNRNPIAPENEFFQIVVRLHLYGRNRSRYRIIYKVDDDCVTVLHFRHGARLP